MAKEQGEIKMNVKKTILTVLIVAMFCMAMCTTAEAGIYTKKTAYKKVVVKNTFKPRPLSMEQQGKIVGKQYADYLKGKSQTNPLSTCNVRWFYSPAFVKAALDAFWKYY